MPIKKILSLGMTVPAKTVGPRVPTWIQVNEAKELLLADKQSFEKMKRRWAHVSTQTWNPFAVPGSPAALLPLQSRVSK